MAKYVFDTSALLCYIENEEGADKVEDLMIQAIEKDVPIFISITAVIELYYISQMEQGEKVADERLEIIKALPFEVVNIGWNDVKRIGGLKANNKISFADSCIASVALQINGILVHKDPEFESLKKVKQLKLPYKKK